MNKKGLLVIISSPSGGGKDTVINALLKLIPKSARLVTTTSRAPRPGNKDGVDYYFISKNEFENKISKNEFVEYNAYADNYYGVERQKLEASLENNEVVFTQIEVNGKYNFDKAGISHLSIFLLPENLNVLRKRIEKRGGIEVEAIEKRLKIAEEEINNSLDYDYRVVNVENELDSTIEKIHQIIVEHLKNQ